MLSGFKQFILRGNVIDLAVGVIIGASFNTVVSALVKDIISPFLGIIGGVPNFSSISFAVNGSKFLVGDFINTLITFLINAAVIYFLIILPLNKFMNKVKKEKRVEPNTKICPWCISSIPVDAKKCAFCASALVKNK